MDALCDLCCSRPGVWRYPTQDFIAYEDFDRVGVSSGAWLACNDCHLSLQCGDLETLAQRAADNFILDTPEAILEVEWVRQQMFTLHAQFLEHRRGEPILIEVNQ